MAGILRGDVIASRFGLRLVFASAIEDERDAIDWKGRPCRKVRYRHWTGHEWHICDGIADCFHIMAGPPVPSVH